MEARGYEVATAETVADGMAAIRRDAAGFRRDRHAAGRRQRARRVSPSSTSVRPDARGIILTGYGNIATAVTAVKLGAFDYLAKPADADEIDAALMRSGRGRAAPPRQPDVGGPRALGAHPARLRTVQTQRLGDGAAARHAPAHPAADPGQARPALTGVTRPGSRIFVRPEAMLRHGRRTGDRGPLDESDLLRPARPPCSR